MDEEIMEVLTIKECHTMHSLFLFNDSIPGYWVTQRDPSDDIVVSGFHFFFPAVVTFYLITEMSIHIDTYVNVIVQTTL